MKTQMTWDLALTLENKMLQETPSCDCNFECPLHDLADTYEGLRQAAEYTLNNLEYAAENKLITAPRHFQVQLSESRRMLKEAINQEAV